MDTTHFNQQQEPEMPRKSAQSSKKQEVPDGYTEGQWKWIQAQPVMIYEPSPFGRICTSKEFQCCRCYQKTKLELPPHFFAAIDSESLVGDVMINDYASQIGWIHIWQRLVNGNRFLYTVCPDCLMQDFQLHERVRDLCIADSMK